MLTKEYLIDVPVKINIWTRPEFQKIQFEILRQARPSILFIQSDGGRNIEEWKNIYENRKIFDEGIDWNCKVYKIYEDRNNGLYTMAKKASNIIWNNVDRCIFLEDDLIPTVNFFKFCSELLEKYKNDTRIECICGFNTLGTWEKASSDYFFSRQGSTWGIATWKRVTDEYRDFSYIDDNYIMELLKQRTKHNISAWKRLNAYANQEIYDGHRAGSEFYHEFFMYSQYRLQIIPRRNMISNIGIGKTAQHADYLDQLPKGIRCLFNSKTFELEFPIRHPKYIIPDVEYENRRNRILAYNYPIIQLYRNIERFIYKLKNGEISYIINKIKNRYNAKHGKILDK